MTPTAVAIRQALLCGEMRAQTVVEAALRRIAAYEPAVHAWKSLDPAHALAQARADFVTIKRALARTSGGSSV